MISYGYNFEDVYIQRLFPGKTDGFYIDVGAADPVEGSVTKHFYDLGWTGINLEPQEAYFNRLRKERPRDINLQLAAGTAEEERTFYSLDGKGGSTLDAINAESGSGRGFQVTPMTVRLTTLKKVCEDHARKPIDFIKVDVEGWERDVLAGADWETFRPMLVVVEATKPFSAEPCHQEWEPLLLEAGYLFAFFDGLNRYYLREEDASLADRLAVPANVFDDFTPYQQHLAMVEVARLKTPFFKRGKTYQYFRRLEHRFRHRFLRRSPR